MNKVRPIHCAIIGIIVIGILFAFNRSPSEYLPEDIKTMECNGQVPQTITLITYATRAGSTAEVAEFIAKRMCEKGLSVELLPLPDVKELTHYSSIILGTPIRMGRVMPEALSFTKNNRSFLRQKPFACFAVCLTMREDTPDNRIKTASFLKPLMDSTTTLPPGLFGGTMKPSRLRGFWKFAFRNKPVEDHRDWQKIGEWTDSTCLSLLGSNNMENK